MHISPKEINLCSYMKLPLKCPIVWVHTTMQVEKAKIMFRKNSDQGFREMWHGVFFKRLSEKNLSRALQCLDQEKEVREKAQKSHSQWEYLIAMV